MVPHKTVRGQEALRRLKTFEGVPPPYDSRKRVVVPYALRVLRMKPGRKFTVLHELSGKVGWKYNEVVKSLEEKRKSKSSEFFTKKQAIVKSQKAKLHSKETTAITQQLNQLGHA